ncbi:MAG: type I 3-dehydroquinate dehydratase [Streptococcaceae bacterium]|jgi:3-dehydroquinate dehydratase-1|nr:type I 3-dehydroquinate dehydratase [Streptococcaceae bacterium]
MLKIVVPVMPKDLAELAALDVAKYTGADLIEWRADYLPIADLPAAAQAIKALFPNQAIIFTYRTEDKGAPLISESDYAALIAQFADQFAYIDIEVLRFPHVALPDNAIASYHDFDQIPEDLVGLLRRLQASTPKVIKFAGMPRRKSDVLRLMTDTLTFAEAHPQQLLVTMAMGELGKVTRLAGENFGSNWTFASVEQASAPGQISLTEMLESRELLRISKPASH